mgnify:CR=1 FL=1
MISKARLVKKEAAAKIIKQMPKTSLQTEKSGRALLTQKTIQTTKDWLASHRQQQNNARQTFAALFMTSETRSNAI